MTLLRHLLEPKRALLAWQSSRTDSSRRRWDVAELLRNDTTPASPVELHYLSREHLAGAIAEGFSGYPAFSMKQPVHGQDVLATFMLRLPPRRRPDFSKYLDAYLIAPDAQFTDFALLAATEGRLPSDGFSVVNPLDEVASAAEFVIEAAGIRHVSTPVQVELGKAVEFRPEPENKNDPNAIAIFSGPSKLGYINRLQTAAFHRWIAQARVTARVEKTNGTPERPRVILHVVVE